MLLIAEYPTKCAVWLCHVELLIRILFIAVSASVSFASFQRENRLHENERTLCEQLLYAYASNSKEPLGSLSTCLIDLEIGKGFIIFFCSLSRKLETDEK